MSVRGLACVRGGRILFEDVSFFVLAGGVMLVTGPNGAGKSSLLRVLAGLLPAAAGAVERPERIAYLGHDNALKLDSRLSAELAHWSALDRASRATVDAAIERFNLAPLLDLEVRMLSNGQRRRAALARVLMGGARLWLLDEPEVGLDRAALHALAAAIAEHRADGGAAVVVSHAALDLPNAAVLPLDPRAVHPI